MSDLLIDVKNLKTQFHTEEGIVHAVNDVSFQVNKKETLGIVGESGSGKSTLARVITGLLAPIDGKVRFRGEVIPPKLKNRPRNCCDGCR